MDDPDDAKFRSEPDATLGIRHEGGQVVLRVIHRMAGPTAFFDFAVEVQEDHLVANDPVVSDGNPNDRVVRARHVDAALHVQV